ncbi:MAG TPA: hypothetical protein VF559_00180 [Caulobacteraceae bacterium]|jgi:LPS sulfotransferase NodH
MSRPFLVTFVGRSGSTALMLDLEQHPHITANMELFGAPLLPRGLPQTDDNRIDFLRQLWAAYRPPPPPRPKKGKLPPPPPEPEPRAIGFKFQFKRSGPQFGDHARLAEAVRPFDPLVIALWRRDLLRQAVSTIRSRTIEQINEREIGLVIPHLIPESGPEARAYAAKPMLIDLAELEAEVDSIRANINDMRAFHGLCPANMMISYETYLANRAGVLKRIVTALGLVPFEVPPAQNIGKITASDLSRAIENWNDVRAFAEARELLATGDSDPGLSEDDRRARSPEERRLRRRVAEVKRHIAMLEDERAALARERSILKKALSAPREAEAASS